ERPAPGDVRAEQPDRSARRGKTPADEVEERRLAGAVRSDQRMPLALLDRQRNAANDFGLAETLAEVRQLERRRASARRGRVGCGAAVVVAHRSISVACLMPAPGSRAASLRSRPGSHPTRA